MRLSEFKQLIKQSILEEKEKETKNTGAMTPEEEEMVADYEREQDAKHALDKEEPMEEAMVTPDNRVEYLANALSQVWNMGTGNNKIDLHSMAQSLVDDMFDQESMQEGLSIPDDIKWDWDGQVLDQTDSHSAEIGLEGYSPSTGRSFTASVPAFDNGGDWEWNDGDVDFIEEAPLEEIIRRTDKIVESWNSKKKPLTEEMTGGYLEIMEMNPKFDEGLELLLDVWNEWKSGEMTEPEMIEEAKQDLLAYLSTMLD